VRLLDYLTGLISLLALPFIAWWGVNQSPHSAARLEAQLEARAQQALQLAGLDWAEVNMDGQTAILTGPAPSPDVAEEAAGIVLRSSGPGGLLFGGVSQVETRVHPAEPVRPYVWRVEKLSSGQLKLSGHVPSKAARAALLEQAGAESSGPAIDEMVVAAGAPAGNWQGIAQFALLQTANLDQGSAVLSDHVLTLRGEASDEAHRAQLTAATLALAAPFRGVALVQGVPLWSAAHSEGELVLSGAVPGEAERRALMTLARRGFDGEVRDEMVVAEASAADWLEGAKAGLGHLAAFRSGTMTFDPAVNGFTFEGEAPASRLQFLSEDMARAAGRWRVVIAAVPEVDAGALAPEAACTDDINRMLETEAVAFVPGRAEFRRENAGALDQLAGIARRCDARVRLELAVDGDALAQARATALADYLERAGVSRPQLAAIAYGPATGVEGMDSGAAVASDRPREFTVRERSER